MIFEHVVGQRVSSASIKIVIDSLGGIGEMVILLTNQANVVALRLFTCWWGS